MIGFKVKVNTTGLRSWPSLGRLQKSHGDLIGIVRHKRDFDEYYTVDFGDLLLNQYPLHDCNGFFNSYRGYQLSKEEFDIIGVPHQSLDDLL